MTWEQVQDWELPGTTPKKPYGYPLAVEAEAGVVRPAVFVVGEPLRLP